MNLLITGKFSKITPFLFPFRDGYLSDLRLINGLIKRRWGNASVDGGRIAKKSRRYVSASFGDTSQDYSKSLLIENFGPILNLKNKKIHGHQHLGFDRTFL